MSFHIEKAPQTINARRPGTAIMGKRIPRITIAGLSGDSGKTIVSLSLLTALTQRGLTISVFKKGPDYIDAAWLSRAAGKTCRNLDTFMVNPEDVYRSFAVSSLNSDFALIEGNRGLYDGMDVSGTHSTAELSKLLDSPVILVVNAAKATRTIAALVAGCLAFDPSIKIAGVILNRTAGNRHRNVITDTIEKYCKIPVLGVIPRLDDDATLIPGRHLGLVTPAEYDRDDAIVNQMTEIAEKYLDIDRILHVASEAGALHDIKTEPASLMAEPVKIGYFRDSAFTFYYPENLEALQKNGAALVPVSSVNDSSLPDIDGLYIGGGFPETHAEKLIENRSLLDSVKDAVESGMPVYAECGGLIFLSRSLSTEGKLYPLTGVFPVDLVMNRKPAGHGYTIVDIDRSNPFFDIGATIRGHEFHYTSPAGEISGMETCMKMQRGSGCGNNRDGLIYKNTLACYTHIHADGVKSWAVNFVMAAGKYRQDKSDSLTRDNNNIEATGNTDDGISNADEIVSIKEFSQLAKAGG